MNIIFISCGNDSIALLQWIVTNKSHQDNIALYSNTGWSSPEWPGRVAKVSDFCAEHGIRFVSIKSEGMEALVRRKKGWPMPASKMQFCTEELKVRPAREYMLEIDPNLEADCYTGIRREESQNRQHAPEFIEQSERHGGRDLYCPLVEYTEEQRNQMIHDAGFDMLPHSSMECFPCVCSNRSDFIRLAEYPEIIDKIANIEREMGYTRNGKPRTMFRPYRHMGAIGIRKVVAWALAGRGKWKGESYCTSGFCNN
jgi:3'-phosphoadenosine 5'-phosphosulfate sulfotransferase (PAPS reductase)/FAD synthetase